MTKHYLPKQYLAAVAGSSLLLLQLNLPSIAGVPGDDLDFSGKSSSWKVKDKNDPVSSPSVTTVKDASQKSSGPVATGKAPISTSAASSATTTKQGRVAKSFGAIANPKADVGNDPSSCTQAQLWALACPALLTLNNKHRHDLLWCVAPTPENIAVQKKSLADWCGINSRQDLLQQLTSLNAAGHRAEFDQMVQISQMGPGAVEAIKTKLDPKSVVEFDEKMQIVQEYGPQLGLKSLLGWDYCRYIGLCRWGTLCGYLTPEEAWAKIMPAARLLQNNFSSWEDLGKNYIIGRHFWQPHSDLQQSFENNYKFLLSFPKSPWVTIPWRTDLAK